MSWVRGRVQNLGASKRDTPTSRTSTTLLLHRAVEHQRYSTAVRLVGAEKTTSDEQMTSRTAGVE